MTAARRALRFGAAVVLSGLFAARPAFARSVLDSLHNLSVSGKGATKSTTEKQVCLFCHSSHSASPAAPLWNRASSGATYTPYTSTTMETAVGQPTGASAVCLSCHDGTIALGAVLSRATPIPMRGGTQRMPPGRGHFGRDLRDDHPISFAFDGMLATLDPQLKHPGTLTGRVKLDKTGQVQCTTCHDPHDDEYGQFLVEENVQSRLCVQCHEMTGWDFADHKLSGATWNGAGKNPWPKTRYQSVSDNACASCHQSHTAPGAARLLHAREEEQVCFPCHNGNVARANVQAEFLKPSRHPVELTTGVHDPTEVAGLVPRHVECQDCHNPHAARVGSGQAAAAGGPLNAVSGITLAGTPVASASMNYEVCLKCHGDDPGAPGPSVPRQVMQGNLRRKIQPGNPSQHGIAARGGAGTVPSLKPEFATGGTITCVDCHNSDSGPGAGGSGPSGPHASQYAPLLERRLDRPLGRAGESPQAYALCYKCHDRGSLLSDASFKSHEKHIRLTGCQTCHDPHGISAGQGNSLNNSHLINFATDTVTTNSRGRMEFVDMGQRSGSCSLKCHNKDHDNTDY